MPRYAKAGQTVEDLKQKIRSFSADNELYVYSVLNGEKPSSVVEKDLRKINVDFENVDQIGEYDMPGTEDMEAFETLNGIPIAWCACGGDWEMPLAFCLYIGDDGKLRGYIPSKGNAYNHKEKCAYGSEQEDGDFDENRDYIFDPDMMREDVKARITVKTI